jgi:hypothetical protein
LRLLTEAEAVLDSQQAVEVGWLALVDRDARQLRLRSRSMPERVGVAYGEQTYPPSLRTTCAQIDACATHHLFYGYQKTPLLS